MAIFEKKEMTELPDAETNDTNVELLNTLLVIVNARYTFTLEHYSEATKQKALGSISSLLTASAMSADQQTLLDEFAIGKLWMNFFDNDAYSRQFLLATHSQFITAIGETNWEQLLKAKAYSLYYITVGSNHSDVNKIHNSPKEIESLFRLYPWLLTYLLIGDISIFLGDLLSEQ